MMTPLSILRKVRYHYWPRVRWGFVRALTPKRLVQSRGLSFTLSCENWITEYRWKNFNDKEPETLDWIDRCVQDGSLFLDIGANVGVYSIYAALRHPHLKVVALEPEFSNLHLLRDNVIANRLQDRISVFALALGNEESISYLHVQDFTPGAALHSVSRQDVSHTKEGKRVVGKEGICVLSLEKFCSMLVIQPNFIKIDVDGDEENILEGAKFILGSPFLKSLLIEIGSKVNGQNYCEDLLKQAGLQKSPHVHSNNCANQIWVRNSSSQEILLK